ncbi:MAG: hypothetical protein EON89_06480 [Brevundimonas sp.]|nr:MAG: hypothetical protein EON89_06480 [Brevundimonas sp.]
MTDDLQNPDPQADFWASVQADYLGGMTAPVLAERYRVSVRTIRRRAAEEGWRRADRSPAEQSSVWRPLFNREAALERFPELADLEQEQAEDAIDLLFYPTQQTLRCFAFRRAAEAAALGRPTEAGAWMRLVASLHVTGERIDADMRPFREAEYLRATYRAGVDPAHIFPEQP